jgi:hypothetical protein
MHSQSQVTEIRTARRRGVRLGHVALCGALFTFSWDTVGGTTIWGFNLKISTVLFLVAAFCNVGAPREHPMSAFEGRIRGLLVLILSWFLISSFLAEHSVSAFAQTARNAVAAIVPLAAVSRGVLNREEWDRALAWLVRGVVVATIFGLYQLFAFHSGLPPLFVNYTGLSGGAGRIAAFNYEPAVFGQVLIVGVAALLCQQRHTPSRLRFAILIGFTMILTNARALFLTAPVFYLLVRRGRLSPRARRTLPILLAFGILLALMIALTQPERYVFMYDQFLSIFDPNEAASNARRLEQYRIDIQIIRDSGFFGLGPAQLFYEVPFFDTTVFEGPAANNVVANNVWLQALLDGGPILLVLEGVLFVQMVAFWWRWRFDTGVRALAACWLSIMIVSGMLFSLYFSPTQWMIVGLISAYASINQVPRASAPLEIDSSHAS